MAVPGMNCSRVLSRPGPDERPFFRSPALPEVRRRSGTSCANPGESLCAPATASNRPPLPSLRHAGESRSLGGAELEAKLAERLPDRVVRDAGCRSNLSDIEAEVALGKQPLLTLVEHRAV